MSCEEALTLPRPVPPDVPVVFVAAAALVDADGRILLAQRPAGKTMAGLWEFPGGKVEPGELPEFALMRELCEELGIETRPCAFAPCGFASHSYADFHLLMPLFICRSWTGLPHGREGQALKWVLPSALYDYDMPAANLALIDPLLAQVG